MRLDFSSFLLPVAAMTAVVVASNWLVQFPINDLLTWGAISYPFSFLITDLTTRLQGAERARRVVWVGFALAVLLSLWLATPRIALASGTAFLVGPAARHPGVSAPAPRHLVARAAGQLDAGLGRRHGLVLLAGLRRVRTLPWITLALGDLGVKLVLAILALAPFRAVLAVALPATRPAA